MSVIKDDVHTCVSCGVERAQIQMTGFAEDESDVVVCPDCALQLTRKLSEDLCAVLSKGGRHG